VRSYDASKHRAPPDHHVHDPKMYALGYLAIILWIQGFPDKARQWSAATLDYTAELNHANMSAFARVYGGAGVCELLRETSAVRSHADSVLELAEQHSLHYFGLSAKILRGWAIALDGDVDEGTALMRRSIDERFALGVGWYQTRYLCMLAEIFLSQNDGRAGLELIKRAKSHIELHDERLWEAEVWRIEGELLRVEGVAQTEIENAYRHSLSIARRQGARSFELRTAMSLARLRRDERRNDAARDALVPVLSRFTEGFGSADVQQARNLLNDVS